jgi:hypothetical protein
VAYDEHVLLQLVNSTVEDVRVKEQLSYDRVLGVVERCLSAKVDWAAYTTLGVLGLDEIALKKGHRDFVVIATARLFNGHVVILGVLPDRLKKNRGGFSALDSGAFASNHPYGLLGYVRRLYRSGARRTENGADCD